MKQIDHASLSSDVGEENFLKKIQSSFQEALKMGAKDVHLQAQEALANQLGRMLDNRYILLRNIILTPGSVAIPMILVGSTGIWVINARGEAGLFKAEGENWLEMNDRTQQLQPASKNLVRQTLDFTQAVNDFIGGTGEAYPVAQPVLFFGHPGAHIDADQQAVRIVRMDGVDRLYGSILAAKPVLDGLQTQKLVDLLVKASEESHAQKVEVKLPDRKEEFWQEEEEEAPEPNSFSQTLSKIDLPPALKNLHLTNQQWTILVVMAAIEVVILIGFILFILIVL